MAAHTITIRYCTLCNWMLRAGWMAQELLSTFGTDLAGGITLIPDTGGVFQIHCNGVPIWDCKTDGGFPDAKVLKQRVRDQIDPTRNLGHIDRHAASHPPGRSHPASPLPPNGQPGAPAFADRAIEAPDQGRSPGRFRPCRQHPHQRHPQRHLPQRHLTHQRLLQRRFTGRQLPCQPGTCQLERHQPRPYQPHRCRPYLCRQLPQWQPEQPALTAGNFCPAGRRRRDESPAGAAREGASTEALAGRPPDEANPNPCTAGVTLPGTETTPADGVLPAHGQGHTRPGPAQE